MRVTARPHSTLPPWGRITLGVVVAGVLSSACSALPMTAAASPLDATVQAALADAARRLGSCEVTDDQRDAALADSDLLDAYNNGDVGPGHCE